MKFGMLVREDIISDTFEFGKILIVGSGMIALDFLLDLDEVWYACL